MFYRPKFCCNCGEKIERAEWSIFTSRKFCEVCSLDLRFEHILPKVALVLVGLVSVTVISSLFRPYERPGKAFADTAVTSQSGVQRLSQGNLNATSASQMQSQRGTNTLVSSNTGPNELVKAPPATPKPAEAVYFCGAVTKKGTACSRRVKHRGERCWQHSGMPAMSDMAITGAK
jgi:hypothetical protein